MVQRINFNRNYKLFSACAKHEDGTINTDMEYVYFIGDYAYASDSHILVKVPLSECTSFEEEDRRKLNNTRIHASLLRVLYGFSEVKITEDAKAIDDDSYETLKLKRIVELSANKADNEIKVVLEEITHHPDFDKVLEPTEARQPINSLGIRAKLLNTLTEAMGAVTIKLQFTQANGKVFVNDFSENSKSIGIIMPLHIDAQLPGFEDGDE